MKLPGGDGMLLRCITAFTLIPLLLLLVWLPQLSWLFAALVLLLTLLGAREYFLMAQQLNLDGASGLGMILAPTTALSVGLADSLGYASHLPLAAVLLTLFAYHLFALKHSLASMAVSVFSVMYLGYFGSFFIALHRTPDMGAFLITFLVFTIGCSDTGAYVIGKAFGKHKLAPRVSPKKTIEGSVAALVSAALSGALLYGLKQAFDWTAYPDWPLAWYMGAALCLSVVGMVGDLTESMLKRNAGVKDSGNVFPGHGGALDRCDAFLFGGPTLYCLVRLIELSGR